MKICIVTQPLHNNYGGILQNYALQKVLRDMGHEPVTIDYEGRKPSFCRVVLSSCKTLCLRIIGRYRPFHGWRLRKRKIGRFVKDNMSLTERVKKYDERIVKDMGAGAVIVGSDQVWREKYNKGKKLRTASRPPPLWMGKRKIHCCPQKIRSIQRRTGNRSEAGHKS